MNRSQSDIYHLSKVLELTLRNAEESEGNVRDLFLAQASRIESQLKALKPSENTSKPKSKKKKAKKKAKKK